MDFVEEGKESRAGIIDRIKGEVLGGIHVVVIVPYHVEWNCGLLVALHNTFYHRQVLIAPPTLVES